MRCGPICWPAPDHPRRGRTLHGGAVRFDAVQHLFRVSCGLESMALGEPQILGQITHAYEQAHEYGAAGTMLSLLFRAAIFAAQRARSETAIGSGAASVSSLGIAKAESARGIAGRARDPGDRRGRNGTDGRQGAGAARRPAGDDHQPDV